MRKLTWFILVLWLAGFAGVVSAQGLAPTRVTAELKNAQGQVVGYATLATTEPGAVRVQVNVTGLATAVGNHGIHIHAVGSCAPDFGAAGGHFNPAGAKHGLDNPGGPHAGDLPNIVFSTDGSAGYEAVTDRITLGPGERSIFDADGTALIIHAGPDDQKTDPTGSSGARIACGVLAAAQPPAVLPVAGGENVFSAVVLALGSLLWIGGLLLRRARTI